MENSVKLVSRLPKEGGGRKTNPKLLQWRIFMEISYLNNTIQKLCTDAKEARKKYGKDGAAILEKRLDQIRGAVNIENLRSSPCGWHELVGDRKGHLACSL
jgi:proteic killer suppression protein